MRSLSFGIWFIGQSLFHIFKPLKVIGQCLNHSHHHLSRRNWLIINEWEIWCFIAEMKQKAPIQCPYKSVLNGLWRHRQILLCGYFPSNRPVRDLWRKCLSSSRERMKISSRFWPESMAILPERPAYPFLLFPSITSIPTIPSVSPMMLQPPVLSTKWASRVRPPTRSHLRKKENSGRGFRQEGRFYLRANYQTSIKHPDVRRTLLWFRGFILYIIAI